MKKKVLSALLVSSLALSVLTGCGSSASGSKAGASASDTASDASSATEASSDSAQGASVASKGKITVAATEVPHAEILEAAKPILAKEGWDLEVTVFEDYIQPNQVVASGEIDCNYFQHQPYLDEYNTQNGTNLVAGGWIHYEPLGIYPGKSSDLKNIPDGVKIAVPNDTTNEARALQLLQDNGIIKLKDGVGLNATAKDVIKDQSHNAEIVELEAAQVSQHAGEVDYMVLNGNYAMQAGLNVEKDALAFEQSDSDAAKTYVNVIATTPEKKDDPGVKALVDVLKSDEITKFINDKYQGSVVPYDGDALQ